MTQYDLYQVDTFTKTKFTGNATSILTDARGLTDAQMLQITRKLNNSETAFVIPGKDTEADVTVRFFTPTGETPVCGHATIAVANLLAQLQQLTTGQFKIRTKAGIIPVTIALDDDGQTLATMTQNKIAFEARLTGQTLANLFQALHVTKADLIPDLPIQIVNTGHSKVMVPLVELATLNQLKPDLALLTKISQEVGANGFYPFVVTAKQPEFHIHGRMFAPISDNDEDPVTGNANGELGAYLVKYGFSEKGTSSFFFKAYMGNVLHRPGVVEVAVEKQGDRPSAVKIAGGIVHVFQTKLEV
ncbi:PhzF family phenazine biosynthesis isomerase [Secundilactobacillus collinoides]|uniref:Epimerase n=2 Tax=Secundilactobacillus collinoides TaxID=33960 RepID=A0A0R2BDW9_SECCO|nr:PhzF family phenazine biosynthesis isomerase [Secundilactobacillus collinoides]KRM76626.1 epimerase [Secundilactobacillus collinoides DSM 20515 = JCM 1123]KZL42686.1 hypothetical protein TY91_04340 [Secundilactobacillus collinoides]